VPIVTANLQGFLMHKRLVISAIAAAFAVAKVSTAAAVEFDASGALPADISPTFEAFRTALGPNNGNNGGTFTSGHREINWDGVPDTIAAPNLMPANQFSKRGAVFFTPGTGFQISAKAGNPTFTPIEFGNIAPFLPFFVQTFSPPRLFTALDSTVTEVLFFNPSTGAPATVNSFGSVFTNVRHFGSTKIEYLDKNGTLLHTHVVQPGTSEHASLSFAGSTFDSNVVYLVRITSGDVELSAEGEVSPDPRHGQPFDLVVMDDFLYGEPQTLVTP
jgi:hypothetical protein